MSELTRHGSTVFTSMPSQRWKLEKKYTSVAAKNIEELRAKYEVMGNVWLLAQLRQPGRSVFSDLEPTTFQKCPEATSRQAGFQPAQRSPGQVALTTELGALLVL